MGDLCDANDLDRFLRSEEGKNSLLEIRDQLVGRTIDDVAFSNEVGFIATVLHMDDGTTFLVVQPSLEVQAIREEFQGVLDREYLKDYPKRTSQHPPVVGPI